MFLLIARILPTEYHIASQEGKNGYATYQGMYEHNLYSLNIYAHFLISKITLNSPGHMDFFTLLIVYGKEIHLKTNMYSHLSKVLGNVKKYPYIINQNHIFFKKVL